MRTSVAVGLVVAIVLTSSVGLTSLPIGSDEADASLKVLQVPGGVVNETIPHIFGASVDWTEHANGLMDPYSFLLSPTPVGELIGLSPSYLRFPAGRLSQDYDWELGVGYGRGLNPSWGDKPQNSDFGTDEFYRLANHTNAEPVMVVDMTKGAVKAGDWVSYCNDASYIDKGKERAANGNFRPYDIKYWELGYEAYSPQHWVRGKYENLSAGARYARELMEYSQVMKAVDPSIKIGAWLVLHPSLDVTIEEKSWNLNFLDTARGTFEMGGKRLHYFDYVVVKVELPRIDELLHTDELLRFSYAKTYNGMMGDLTALMDLLENYRDERLDEIPVAVASFGPDFGGEDWNVRMAASSGAAVITADIAMELLRSSVEGSQRRILYACYSELSTPTFAALMVNPDFEQAETDRWQRTPSYYVMDMCAELEGRRLRASPFVKVPSFSVEADDPLPTERGVPLINVLVASDAAGERYWLMLTNHDLERTVNVRVVFEGVGSRFNLTEQVLVSDSPLSSNLYGEAVTAPRDHRMVALPELELELPPATVMLITLEASGVV